MAETIPYDPMSNWAVAVPRYSHGKHGESTATQGSVNPYTKICQDEGMANRQWRVVCTDAQSEYLAAAALEHNGLELFFPCVKTARPRVGHTTTPLFPGYIFLRFDPEEGWPPIHQIPHILGWLRFQGDVPTVPDEVIAQLVLQVEAINFGGGLWTRFRPGEKVRVVCSVMEGVAEILEEAKSPQARVRVLLDFMDRLVPAEVAWQNLQPIGDALEGAQQRRLGDRRTRGRGRWIRGFGRRAATNA